VALAWLEDLFALFKEQGWGWSLWNLHGSFGVLDSERKDVKYENYKGHKLDRQLLELLRRS
jgi:endoglucanase